MWFAARPVGTGRHSTGLADRPCRPGHHPLGVSGHCQRWRSRPVLQIADRCRRRRLPAGLHGGIGKTLRVTLRLRQWPSAHLESDGHRLPRRVPQTTYAPANATAGVVGLVSGSDRREGLLGLGSGSLPATAISDIRTSMTGSRGVAATKGDVTKIESVKASPARQRGRTWITASQSGYDSMGRRHGTWIPGVARRVRRLTFRRLDRRCGQRTHDIHNEPRTLCAVQLDDNHDVRPRMGYGATETDPQRVAHLRCL